MCSIMGYCSCNADIHAFKAGFEQTLSRGPDDSRITDTGKGLLGFHRLAIMGLHPEGMQPFERNGSYVVCNGELYGFAQMKAELQVKGYSFISDSDCEILLPMYEFIMDMMDQTPSSLPARQKIWLVCVNGLCRFRPAITIRIVGLCAIGM